MTEARVSSRGGSEEARCTLRRHVSQFECSPSNFEEFETLIGEIKPLTSRSPVFTFQETSSWPEHPEHLHYCILHAPGSYVSLCIPKMLRTLIRTSLCLTYAAGVLIGPMAVMSLYLPNRAYHIDTFFEAI